MTANLISSKRTIPPGYRSLCFYYLNASNSVGAFLYQGNESGWIGPSIDRAVDSYKNSNPDWELFDYTYILATKASQSTTGISQYVFGQAHNRPYPPALQRGKNYLEIGRELTTPNANAVAYHFFKPIAVNADLSLLKSPSGADYVHYTKSDKYFEFFYPTNATNATNFYPRTSSDLTELQSIFTADGWQFVSRQYTATNPAYPTISVKQIYDFSYPRSFYTTLATLITSSSTLENIRNQLGDDFYHRNFSKIKLLHDYYNGTLTDSASINNRLTTLEEDIIQIDTNITPLTTQIAGITASVSDLTDELANTVDTVQINTSSITTLQATTLTLQNNVTSNTALINTLSSNHTSLTDRVILLENNQINLTTQLTQASTSIASIESQISNLSSLINNKTDSSAFNSLVESFNSLSASHSSISNRVTVLENSSGGGGSTDLTPLFNEITDIKSNIVSIQTEISSLDPLNETLAQLQTKVSGLETEIANLDNYIEIKINEHSNSLMNLNTSLNTVNSNLGTLTSSLQNYTLKTDLDPYAMKSDLDPYALKSDLDLYASKGDMNLYTLKTDLDPYALKTDLDLYVLKTQLNSYATTSSVQSAYDQIITLTNQINSIQLPDVDAIESSITTISNNTVLIQNEVNSVKNTLQNMPVQYIPISTVDTTPQGSDVNRNDITIITNEHDLMEACILGLSYNKIGTLDASSNHLATKYAKSIKIIRRYVSLNKLDY